MRLFLGIFIAAIAGAISITQAQAGNLIVFGADPHHCGGAVLCSTDGTRGYTHAGKGQPFKASTISKWFQIDVHGTTRLKQQIAEPNGGSGAFLVVNDTGRPITKFALRIGTDSNPKNTNEFSAQGDNGKFKYDGMLSGKSLVKCDQGKPARRTCVGVSATAEFASNEVVYSWSPRPQGAIPKGARFLIKFSSWNSDAWAAKPPQPSIVLISQDGSGNGGNGPSFARGSNTWTTDSNNVVFLSWATNLPGGSQTNMTAYIYNVTSALLTAVPTPVPLSVDYNDDPWTTISGDGTLAGYTGGNYWTNDYIYDVTNQTTLILSTNGNRATTADLSGDGSYLIYDMVPWDTGVETVWSYNVSTGATIQMLAPDGSQPNNAGCQSAATNGNGELVLLICTATNLVTGVSSSANYLWDQFANTFTLLTRSTDGQEGVPTASDGIGAITSDGQYVAFSSPATDLVPGGTTGDQAFVYDTTTQATALVSSTSDGTAGDGSDAGVGGISADGRYVVFHYYGTNFGSCGGLPGVFVKDLQTGELQCVGGGVVGNISPDGQHVVFNSGGSGSQVYLATLQW